MRAWCVLGGLLVGGSCCWADVTVIYRKADRLIAGYVKPPMSVQAELRNTVQSELGGTEADYATVVVDDATWKANQGKQPLITPIGTVTFQDSPTAVATQQRQQAAKLKLQTLGITVQDLKDALGE